MASWDDDRSEDEIAALANALAHPARVAFLRLLRTDPDQTVAALRAGLAPTWVLDSRGALHHLQVMARAGILDLRGQPRRARLLRNVRLQTHAVP